MKKFFSLMLFAMGLVFTANAWAGGHSSDVMAPDRVSKWDWGVGISGGINDEANDAVFLSTAFSYGVTPYIGLGVEAGWQEADSDNTAEDTIGVVPIMADIILRIPTVHDKLVPYGVLGLGGAGVYISRDNQDDVDDTAFAWKLGGGADWFISDNRILNFEFAYWNAGAELPGTSVDDDYNWWTLGVGLKYVF